MKVVCPRCGERATIRKCGDAVEVECPKCHVAEYGETLEKAVRCFAAEGDRGR